VPYWNGHDKIGKTDGVMIKGDRIVIPRNLDGNILTHLHNSWLDIKKTEDLAKTVLFWSKFTIKWRK